MTSVLVCSYHVKVTVKIIRLNKLYVFGFVATLFVSLSLLVTPTASAFSSAQPYGQPGAWNMIFEDNFDGTSLDTTKWRPNWLGSSDTAITTPINSLEKNCYNPANVSVSGGSLVLRATANTSSTCKDRSNSQAAYSSGMIESRGKAGGDFAYGYMEASILMPAGPDHQSVWPAFWSDGSPLNWPSTGEIDVVECYGTDASCSYHYHYSGGGPGGTIPVSGSTTGFHVYAANWEPGKITWYIDGIQAGTQTSGVVSNNMFLIANLGMIGTSGTVPQEMKIDYIRVWKKSTSTPSPTPVSTTTSVPTIVPTIPPTVGPTVTPTSTPKPWTNQENDYSIWFSNYLKSIFGFINGDFNENGVVDGVDYVVWLNNYGK